MRAFGREVASRTIAGVLAGVILAALALVWASITYIAPSIAAAYNLSFREALAWATVISLVAVVLLESLYVASLQRRKPTGSFTMTPNSGDKPSVTLTHHGDPTTYRVDGRIVMLNDARVNPAPAQFQCELQVSGMKGQWEAELNDAEWANIILGGIEPVYADGAVGKVLVGDTLVIRRGKIGMHVRVPDAGAIVELKVRSPPNSQGAKWFRLVRHGNTVAVTKAP